MTDAGNSHSTGVLDTVSTASRSQSWSLDALGNWSSLTTDGTTHTRCHNSQNQITAIQTETTPTYDNNGDTTTDNAGQQYTYDAWNHLMNDGASPSYRYAYDALGRRIHRPSGAEEELYYSASWQVLETRVAANMLIAIRQYVWSPVYVDAMVLRDRDTTYDGSANERLYCLQDANFNVTSTLNTTGTIVERYRYDPYGSPTYLDASFDTRANSSYDWAYLHQGGYYDTTFGSLYYFRNRDLHPTLGRWMQDDPLGYVDAVTLYGAQADNPINRTGPEGLEWKIQRNNGKQRAKATGECGDTINDLAPKINMDPKLFTFWLKSEDNKPKPRGADEKLTDNRVFSVPNTIFVGVADINYIARKFTGSTPGVVAETLRGKGFFVDYQDWYFLGPWNANEVAHYGWDLYGIAYFGHGVAPGKPGWHGKKSGDDGMTGWLDPAGNGSAGYINPGIFSDGQFGLLILKSCFAANGGWGARVSPNGASWLGNGYEAAGFDWGITATAEKAK